MGQRWEQKYLPHHFFMSWILNSVNVFPVFFKLNFEFQSKLITMKYEQKYLFKSPLQVQKNSRWV